MYNTMTTTITTNIITTGYLLDIYHTKYKIILWIKEVYKTSKKTMNILESFFHLCCIRLKIRIKIITKK